MSTLKMMNYSLFFSTYLILYICLWWCCWIIFQTIVNMQKRIVRYVCHLPALTPTSPLFVKNGLLKLNYVLKLQVCKLMQNSITGFYVEHKSFTLAISLYSHIKTFSKKLNFIIGRPRTRLGLNSFSYLSQRFWSGVPENWKK